MNRRRSETEGNRLARSRGLVGPFTVDECDRAARVVWRTTGFTELVVRVGCALDMRPANLTPDRAALARRLRVSVAEVDTAEMLWSLTAEDVRFRTVLDAVRVARRAREGLAFDVVDKGPK